MPGYIASHTVFEAETGTLPPKEPIPVTPPACWEVVEGDGQIPALQMVDFDFDSRLLPLWTRIRNFFTRLPLIKTIVPRSHLAETNMTFPDRPVTLEGILGFLLALLGWRVASTSKIITDLNKKPVWIEWITDCIGERNAENFPQAGDGYCDTGAWKLMSATAGGNWRKVREIIIQNGTKYCILELLDFNITPEKREDGWYYNGEKKTYRTHSYLFNVRTNRKVTNIMTWLTAGGINISNDVGLEGGKGHEAWPCPVKGGVAAQRLMDMWLLPALPAEMTVYADSLIVYGDLVEQRDGILCQIIKYRIWGPDIFGFDSVRGNWYKLSEMLVRGTLELRNGGNGFDLRVYSPSLLPNRRVVPSPDCGWLRP